MHSRILRVALLVAALAACVVTASTGCEIGTDTCRAFDDRDPGAPSGAACDPGDCQDSLRCHEGVCRGTGYLGGLCTSGGGCDEGLVCEDDVCHGPRTLAVGELCSLFDPEPCVGGAYCSPASTRCEPQASRGMSCERDDACLGALLCVAGACADVPTAGQRCSAVGRCAEGHFCDRFGRCQPLPIREGDACGRTEQCPAGTWCEDGACLPRRGEDEPCEHLGAGPSCLEHLYCDDGTCRAPGAEGERCERGQRCEGDLVCQLVGPGARDYRCAEGLSPGDYCGDGQVCGPGSYCDERREVDIPD